MSVLKQYCASLKRMRGRSSSKQDGFGAEIKDAGQGRAVNGSRWPADRRPRFRKPKRGDWDKRAKRKKERTTGRSGWCTGTAGRRKGGRRDGRTGADGLLYYEHHRAPPKPPPKRRIPARMEKAMESCMDRGCNRE